MTTKATSPRVAMVLLAGPLIWGLGFVATKATLAGSGPLWANAFRFVFAIAVLLPFAARAVARQAAAIAMKPTAGRCTGS